MCRCSIDVTFWDVMAKQFVDALENAEEFPAIIIIASAKISSWQGTNHTTSQVDISNCSSTKFYINYDDHTVSHLRKMYVELKSLFHNLQYTVNCYLSLFMNSYRLTTSHFSQYDFSSQIRHKITILSTKEIQKLGKEHVDVSY